MIVALPGLFSYLFILINLYGPNKDTPNFFDNKINTTKTIGNDRIIICRDFKVVQDVKLDYFNYTIIHKKNIT